MRIIFTEEVLIFLESLGRKWYYKDGTIKIQLPYIFESTENENEFKFSQEIEDHLATTQLSFGLAIQALKNGKCVARKGWNGENMFVYKQIPATISSEIVPKMQSLPQSAKDRLGNGIHYENQMLIIKDSVANSWLPSSSDIFAEDWYILWK